MKASLRIIDGKERVYRFFCIRTDKNDVPFIKRIDFFKKPDRWGAESYFPVRREESKNNLYPYDRIHESRGFKINSISDCYSRGYIFYDKNDAIRRIEALLEKKEEKMIEIQSEVASWKSRLELIKTGYMQ